MGLRNWVTSAGDWLDRQVLGNQYVDDRVARRESSGSADVPSWYNNEMRFNEEQARIQREFERSQAEAMMNFQKNMYSTQIQRLVKDAQAAGVNPAAVLGQASSPSGAMASGSSASASVRDSQNNQNQMLDVMRSVLGLALTAMMIKTMPAKVAATTVSAQASASRAYTASKALRTRIGR